jgi:hypothetical protein
LNIATYGQFTMGKLNHLFCRKVSFLTDPHGQFLYESELAYSET